MGEGGREGDRPEYGAAGLLLIEKNACTDFGQRRSQSHHSARDKGIDLL